MTHPTRALFRAICILLSLGLTTSLIACGRAQDCDAILATSRGAGEVAPILLTGAAYFLPDLPNTINSQFMHLGYHTYVLATQSPDVEATRPLLYGSVLVLLLLTFTLNFVAVLLRSRTRSRANA